MANFTDSDLADLDALLANANPKEKEKVKVKAGGGRGRNVQVAPVDRRESPVATGLSLQVEARKCKACGKVETFVVGSLVVYRYQGGVIRRPLSEMNRMDWERMQKTGAGDRDVDVLGRVEIEQCVECSEESLRMWKMTGKIGGGK